MKSANTNTGRTSLRPVAYLGGAALVLAVLAFGLPGSERIKRGPASMPNPNASEPIETETGSFSLIVNGTAPDSIVLDSIHPNEPSQLLFFQGRPVQPDHVGGGLTLDGAGGLLRIDDDLSITRLLPEIEGREVTSVAAAPDNGLWLVTGNGEVARVDRNGKPVTEFKPGPFIYSLVASDAHGNGFLVRSPDQTGFRPVFGSTPLVAQLDAAGDVETTIGGGFIPKDFLLTHLASAGRIAITDSVVYYAPFIRDEVVAMSMTGDTLWVAERGLPQEVTEPRFEVIDREPLVDYAPVNLGIAVGPDEHVYVISIPGFTTDESRLDVFEPSTGRLLRSTTIHNPLPTLAADADGRVYAVDEFALLTGVPAAERPQFAEFDLETLSGHHMTNADLAGNVTLVNFWANWCAPCRIEMPALDSLAKSITAPDFRFVTMNEDVRTSEAASFMNEHGFDFPVLLGKGNLREKYHYIGLPHTVLLDRTGKVVQRWIGYAGEQQIAAIRAVALAELERGAMDMANMTDMFGEHVH